MKHITWHVCNYFENIIKCSHKKKQPGSLQANFLQNPRWHPCMFDLAPALHSHWTFCKVVTASDSRYWLLPGASLGKMHLKNCNVDLSQSLWKLIGGDTLLNHQEGYHWVFTLKLNIGVITCISSRARSSSGWWWWGWQGTVLRPPLTWIIAGHVLRQSWNSPFNVVVQVWKLGLASYTSDTGITKHLMH